jgi:hypothetical protein
MIAEQEPEREQEVRAAEREESDKAEHAQLADGRGRKLCARAGAGN